MESIYMRILTALRADGTLPENFSIQPQPADPKALRFADGARDGISYYHTGGGGNEALLERLESVTSLAAGGGSYEVTEEKLSACFGEYDGVLGCVDGLQKWIIEHRQVLDVGRLFQFASRVLTGSASLGAVKYALAVLELMAGSRGTWREAVRTLSRCDELTLFCVFVACRWDDRDDVLFEMAQKTRGWGRVHAVRELEPTARGMRDWLLDEGWDNGVLPAYTALHCARAGGLLERLSGEPLSRKQLDSADGLIRALLDEGPCLNISLMEEGEELLLAWLDQLEQAERSEEDQRTLKYLREETGERDWPRFQARAEALLHMCREED